MNKEKIDILKKEYLSTGLNQLLNEDDWKYQKIFSDNWNIDATDFGTMINKSILAIKNFSKQIANPYYTIALIGNKFPEYTRQAFKDLFDLNSDLSTVDRVNNFRNKFNKNSDIIDFCKKRGQIEKKGHFSDAQTNSAVCSYLWLRYPEKFYKYNYEDAKTSCKYLCGDSISGGFKNRYNKFMKFMDELKKEIFSDSDFTNNIKTVLKKKGYDFNNTKVLSHIVFFESKRINTLLNSETDNETDIIENTNGEMAMKKFENIDFSRVLNIILYGPPGTGKTYNTKKLAVYMCDGQIPNSYEELSKRYKELINKGRIEFVTFHQAFSYEEFIGGLKPDPDKNGNIIYHFVNGIFKDFCDNNRNKKEKCVFIIDEINRGNIAKIFGELITLIETSKREGMPEETSAILPYEKGKPFTVPCNVNILGTMNTADRSITQIDTALRRRFNFIELMPDYDFLNHESENEEFNLKELVEKMNKRIEILYDREHVIGHSYFADLKDNFKISDLTEIFINNIIPLLKEYFYEDYYKIQLVLGEFDPENPNNFIIRVKNDNNLFSNDIDLDDIDQYTYIVNDNPNNITLDTYNMILNNYSNAKDKDISTDDSVENVEEE